MIKFFNLSPDVRAAIRSAGIQVNPAANIYYVQSISASAGNSAKDGKDPTNPFATLAGLIASGPTLVANDIVVLLSGHAETISAAGFGVLPAVGINIIGVGEGSNRPTFTFGTATTATWTMTKAGTVLKNVIFTNTLDQVVSPLVISAAGCRVQIEILDSADNVEFVEGVLTTAAADDLRLDVRYRGRIAGTHCTAVVKLVGCDGGRIDVDAYGKFSTAVVNFITTASTDVMINGRIYNASDLANFAKDVVDTVTGSVWGANLLDIGSAQLIVGGSGLGLGANSMQPRLAIFAKPDVTVAGTSGAWTTANSPITIFTVTGDVHLRVWGVTTAAFTSTGTTGTLALGVTSGTGAFIAATTANGTNFPAANVPWTGTTATVRAILIPNSSGWFISSSGNVILTIATNNMTAGGMTIYCEWIPKSSGATVVAATP